MTRTAVVIVHYQNESDTLSCLQSVLQADKTGLDLTIIVILNEFSTEIITNIKKLYPQTILIINKENYGFAKSNNIGIKKAQTKSCDNFILLNNDTIISHDLFVKLVAYAKSDSQIGIISPKIYFAPHFEYHKDRYSAKDLGKIIWYAGGLIDWNNIYATHWGVDEKDVGQVDRTKITNFATGCCMLIKSSVINKIGYFDENYFLYFEDIDYSIRAQNHGFKVIYYPKTFLWHKNASSSGKPGSYLHVYYQTRNRLYFGFKYASLWTKKSLFIDSLKLLFKNRITRKAVFDYYLGKMGGIHD